MKFGHIELLVRDPHASTQFYCEVLGFEVEAVQGESFIWLKKGAVEVLLRPGKNHPLAARYEDAPVGFVLYTPNLAESLAHLEAAGVVIKGTVDSENCFTFTDPDGNWFQLVNPNDH
jgi:catechol 2,3-dioxygenase-like lactoylglutathione lyase family enzyme